MCAEMSCTEIAVLEILRPVRNRVRENVLSFTLLSKENFKP
jgi:hypothetical protein